MTALANVVERPLPALERAREYAEASHAANTRRGYATGWRIFSDYCITHGFTALPASPQTVVLYVSHLAERVKYGTVQQRLMAIAFAHREHGLESPTRHEMVRRVVRGIARTNGTAQTKKAAITLNELRAMLLAIRGSDLKASRDRAMVLLGFAGALRRSELAALNVEDLSWTKKGLLVTIRRSKTDQTGDGHDIAIPFVPNKVLCAATAAREWLNASGITEGALFRTFTLARRITVLRIDGRDVANLVKALASRARLDGDFSGHSLRAGFATAAAQAKVSLDAIARTTRHKSLTVLMGYVRPAQAFDDVALTSIVA